MLQSTEEPRIRVEEETVFLSSMQVPSSQNKMIQKAKLSTSCDFYDVEKMSPGKRFFNPFC